MYKIKPDDKAELQNLLKEPDAVEKWLLADIEKYAEEDWSGLSEPKMTKF